MQLMLVLGVAVLDAGDPVRRERVLHATAGGPAGVGLVLADTIHAVEALVDVAEGPAAGAIDEPARVEGREAQDAAHRAVPPELGLVEHSAEAGIIAVDAGAIEFALDAEHRRTGLVQPANVTTAGDAADVVAGAE